MLREDFLLLDPFCTVLCIDKTPFLSLRLSDTAVLLQLRPFLLAYLSYAVLGEALTPPQIVASGMFIQAVQVRTKDQGGVPIKAEVHYLLSVFPPVYQSIHLLTHPSSPVVAALGEVLIIKPPWLFSTHQSEPTSPGGISHESSPARLFGMILLLVPIFTNCGNSQSFDLLLYAFDCAITDDTLVYNGSDHVSILTWTAFSCVTFGYLFFGRFLPLRFVSLAEGSILCVLN